VKFEPKELERNVNVSETSPLRELFVLLGGALVVILGIYIALGFAVDLLAPHVPAKVDRSIGALFAKPLEYIDTTAETKRLQRLLDDLALDFPIEEMQFRIFLAENPQANAFALPGGNIVVFSGLLNEAASENELAFVLAHELGHFAHRDHLKAFGRGLIVLTLAMTILGEDNPVTQFFLNSLANVEMKFSQRQERAADLWAVDLLNRKYGHAGGACDFLKRIGGREKQGRFQYYFKSHPHPMDRVAVLEQYIRDNNYAMGATSPVPTAPDEAADSSGTK